MTAGSRGRQPLVVAAIIVVVVAVIGGAALAGSLVRSRATPTPSSALVSPSTTPTPGATPSPSTSSSPSATPTASISSEPTASPSPTPEPTPTPVPAPLTGRLVAPAIAARHPIAVMIDDLGPARPQSGLASADVVWHAPAEGGIPRYMAIFQSDLPDVVGPVRSSRYYYIAWATEWKAVYAHAGGSPQALQTLAAKGRGQWVYNIEAFRHGTTFYRLDTRLAPHNLYVKGTTLRKLGKQAGAKDKAYSTVWQFAPDAPLDARPYGGSISVQYFANKVTYRYDRKTNRYLRSVSGEGKQFDASDGRRIAPKNVIVMRMHFAPLNLGTPDRHHRLEATVVGSGTAWISTNGKTIKGTWKKTSMTKPTRFYDKNGNEVTLTIGQTFIQVMKLSDPISFKAGSMTPPATASPSPSP